ncbi:sensor histidine kinase [Flavobacterium rhizosphaerae]|uniref:histidine kinase n=1 Tax=Flavobacterium rhizosphaerae TaxID=3163298 RepID=A0ABW8YZD0_9FLAO
MSLKYKYALSATGIFVAFLGFFVILGWFLDSNFIKHILPGQVSMKFNTALCFILAGMAFCTRHIYYLRKWRSITCISACIVLLYGGISLLQEMFTEGFGIDEFFIKDIEAPLRFESNPGRMSPLTAGCFFLTGLGLLLQDSHKRKLLVISQYLFHIITLVAFICIIGYIFNVPRFYKWHFVNSMAVHTAITFFIMSIVATLAHAHLGIPRIFTASSIGNKIARKLFFRFTLYIIISSFCCLLLYNAMPQEIEFTIAFFTVISIVAGLYFISKTAIDINVLAKKEKLAEENLRLTIESAPYAIILSDIKGTIELVNRQTERMYGYSRKELINENVGMLIPIEKYTKAISIYKPFSQLQDNILFDGNENISAIKKNGEIFPVELILTPIKTERGIMVITAVNDITVRKRNEETINKQLEELQYKNQELEQFNYIASHDLQEPLRTVSNYINLLLEDYNQLFNDEVKQHLSAMQAATTRMTRLVRTLLDFGKLGHNRKLSLTDCQMVINDVTTDLNTLINHNDACIIITTPMPVVYAYSGELHQLFQNLINNAIKFRKKNIPPRIKIGHVKKNGYFQFSISDNGIGIAPEYSEQIFHLFQRVKNGTEYEGHGIGLANCKKITEMHGGKIWVESKPGKGSTFYFTISNFKA